ncbi:flp pilus-assembly TadE/G-like family protein [Kribbella sp. NPDC058693]|uniref:flp pilus-assembly TadE/G-like family protein n=1 Tax=Kribbella sp. NPDC058693 TaxID=3346602 RepID=UPI00365B9F43
MTRSERGSATIHTLLAAVLLITALAAATLWSTVSTARHKLTTAADLTALSAAQSLATSESPTDPAPASDATRAAATTDTTYAAATTDTTYAAATTDATVAAATTDGKHATVTSLTAQRHPARRSSNGEQPLTGAASLAAPTTPCETAARIAILNKVRLAGCDVTADSVTVEVSLELDLPFGHRTLVATARAGPL